MTAEKYLKIRHLRKLSAEFQAVWKSSRLRDILPATGSRKIGFLVLHIKGLNIHHVTLAHTIIMASSVRLPLSNEATGRKVQYA